MKVDYTVAQKVIHWVMAMILMMDLFVAQKFGNPMELADRLESRVDHGSLGIIVTLLFLARIYLRVKNGAADLPSDMPDWQKLLAKWAHVLLYFLIGFLVLSGIATAMNATSPIALFGQFDITLGQSDDDTFAFIRQFHEIATEAIILLIGIHLAAAIYHGVVKKDGTLGRMLKFWRSAPSTD